LPDDREVWLGHSDDGAAVYIRFRNKDLITNIAVSREAFRALLQLALCDTSPQWRIA
jgi:hypothetical protein